MPDAQGSLVTVVLGPREKYSVARATVTRLLSLPSMPFDLIVVNDNRAPRKLRRWLDELAEAQVLEHVHLDRCAGVNEARMAGLSRAQTRYVIFVDNDVWVHDGAIDALVRCAEETGASAVAPAYCIGVRDADRIHHVQGDAHITVEEGHRRLHESTRFENRSLREVRQQLSRAPCTAIEMHCALVRVEDLQRAGGLDVHLGSSLDCPDLAFRAQAQNGVCFEPAAVVTYNDGTPKLSDLRLYFDRWSIAQVDHDIERFINVWQLDPTDPQFNRHRSVLAHRRWKLLHGPRKLLGPLVDQRLLSAAKRCADRLVDRAATVNTVEPESARAVGNRLE